MDPLRDPVLPPCSVGVDGAESGRRCGCVQARWSGGRAVPGSGRGGRRGSIAGKMKVVDTPGQCLAYGTLGTLALALWSITKVLDELVQPVNILQRTFLDWTPCFPQP